MNGWGRDWTRGYGAAEPGRGRGERTNGAEAGGGWRARIDGRIRSRQHSAVAGDMRSKERGGMVSVIFQIAASDPPRRRSRPCWPSGSSLKRGGHRDTGMGRKMGVGPGSPGDGVLLGVAESWAGSLRTRCGRPSQGSRLGNGGRRGRYEGDFDTDDPENRYREPNYHVTNEENERGMRSAALPCRFSRHPERPAHRAQQEAHLLQGMRPPIRGPASWIRIATLDLNTATRGKRSLPPPAGQRDSACVIVGKVVVGLLHAAGQEQKFEEGGRRKGMRGTEGVLRPVLSLE